MGNPFENQVLLEWFLEDEDWTGIFPQGVVTTGSGPFKEDDLDDFLRQKGIKAKALGTDLNILVLGCEGWDEEELDEHIDLRRGKELFVCSQEMLLSYLISDRDPYNSQEVLAAFGEGHPALEYIKEWWFPWPETWIVPGPGDGGPGDPDTWPKVGLLKYLGYRVGVTGTIQSKRQEILGEVFTSPLPNVHSIECMEEWGSPGSSRRLEKMANSIASFARNAKRSSLPRETAICDWEEDLAWLKEEFYRGRFTFQWPTTFVNW